MWNPMRSWCAACLVAGLALVSGCGSSRDEGFHNYSEPTAAAKPVAQVTPTETAADEIITVSAQNVRVPPPATPEEVAKLLPGEPADPRPPVQPTTQGHPTPKNPAPAPELALTIPPAPPAAVALASVPQPDAVTARPLELLIPEKTFKVEGPDGALRVSFDDVDLLKVLNADPVPLDVEEHLPAWLSGLNGKRVCIRGWMFPPSQEKELDRFMFVRDNQICCFGRQAKIYDKFGVRMREGETTNYIFGHPFDVIGRMVVKTRIFNGELAWLYTIEDAVVVDK